MDKDVACSDAKVVRRVVARLTKDELEEVFVEWGLVAHAPPVWPARTTLIELLAKHMEEGMTHQQFAALSLKRVIARRADGGKAAGRGRPAAWDAMRVVGAREKLSMDFSAAALKALLARELGVFFSNYVHVEQAADGDVWIFVGIYEGVDTPRKLPPRSQTSFVLWRPHTATLFVSQVKQDYRAYVFQALMHAFSADALQPLDASGTNLNALVALVLDAPSLGAYSTHGSSVANPLALKRTRMTAEPVAPGAPIPVAVVEDEPARKKRKKLADAVIGAQAAPHQEQLVFRIDSSWDFKALPRQATAVPALPFKAHVVIEGPSVLNGLRSLIPSGIMRTPVAPFYPALLSSGRTVFDLSDDNIALTTVVPEPRRARRTSVSPIPLA